MGAYWTWLFTLEPYTKTRLLYRCPSDPNRNWEQPLLGQRTPRRVSYGTNFWMLPKLWGEQDRLDYNSLASIVSPSNTIYIAEMKANTTGDHSTPVHGGIPTSAAASTTSNPNRNS